MQPNKDKKKKPMPAPGNYVPRRDWGDDMSDYEEKERQRLQDAVALYDQLPSSLRR